MIHLSTTQFSKEPTEALKRMAEEGERIILRKGKKDLAVIVSLEDAELLREMEDHIDLEAAREALAEPGPNIPYEEVRKKLGL
jgi:PHD/YefM family antitoxin component YafN of YafNO toxin-antitoxin module